MTPARSSRRRSESTNWLIACSSALRSARAVSCADIGGNPASSTSSNPQLRTSFSVPPRSFFSSLRTLYSSRPSRPPRGGARGAARRGGGGGGGGRGSGGGGGGGGRPPPAPTPPRNDRRVRS